MLSEVEIMEVISELHQILWNQWPVLISKLTCLLDQVNASVHQKFLYTDALTLWCMPPKNIIWTKCQQIRHVYILQTLFKHINSNFLKLIWNILNHTQPTGLANIAKICKSVISPNDSRRNMQCNDLRCHEVWHRFSSLPTTALAPHQWYRVFWWANN